MDHGTSRLQLNADVGHAPVGGRAHSRWREEVRVEFRPGGSCLPVHSSLEIVVLQEVLSSGVVLCDDAVETVLLEVDLADAVEEAVESLWQVVDLCLNDLHNIDTTSVYVSLYTGQQRQPGSKSEGRGSWDRVTEIFDFIPKISNFLEIFGFFQAVILMTFLTRF